MTPSYDEEDGDPWAAARDRSREIVRAAFAPRSATCPSCGVVVEADGRTCPSCGAGLVQTRPKWRPSRRGVVAGTVAGVVLVAAVVLFAGGLRGDAGSERRAAAERTARLVRSEVARLTEAGLPRTARGPAPGATVTAAAGHADPTGSDARVVRAYRDRLVTVGERAITADARARTPDDPPRGTACEPTPDGPGRTAQEQDPQIARNRYECIAYERRFPLSALQGKARTGVFGIPYWLVADYTTGALTFCKLTPRGGEGAKTLANVPVDPACRDPFKRQSR